MMGHELLPIIEIYLYYMIVVLSVLIFITIFLGRFHRKNKNRSSKK